MKKTLQNELKSNEKNGGPLNNIVDGQKMNATSGSNNVQNVAAENDQLVNNNIQKASAVVMDDVNFKYLKHVILKFLTSREVTFFATHFIFNFF